MEVPLPWERLLWTARAIRPAGARLSLTDFRIVVDAGARSDELAIHDIAAIHRRVTTIDRLLGTSTLVVTADRERPPLVLHHVRRGAELAGLLEMLAGDPHGSVNADAVRAALAWRPAGTARTRREAVAACGVVVVAVAAAVSFAPRGSAAAITYPADDSIYPGGQKRNREAIVRFMEQEVMPWARRALAPVVGSADAVTCATCHGSQAAARGWQMPAVAALPAPQVRELGWDGQSGRINPQIRNAIYGYLAESEKQHTAGYMREIVMPGMARLLHRPAYDFTRSYEYNRTRLAFGCYHCHRLN